MRYFLWLCLVQIVAAQTPAGGHWLVAAVTDQMTDARSEQFYLSADSPVDDSGMAFTPTLNVLCTGTGRFNGIQLQTGLVLAVPTDSESHLYPIKVRFDDKVSTIFWNRFADGKTLGLLDPGILGNKRYSMKLLKARELRIELPTFSGNSVTVRFRPSGLDFQMLARSCGLK